ncbi:uncharacterized protein [Lepeophtheirus salmonis]|uniref:uncharacterized protein isoform X2 n=1 Tax=Lepeophtheirus salmonis TaxID=72036 RepID=UPI003AF3CFB4
MELERFYMLMGILRMGRGRMERGMAVVSINLRQRDRELCFLREEMEFVQGIPHGKSHVKNPDGSKEIRSYINGQKNGNAKLTLTNGDTLEFNYVNDSIEGKAIYKADKLVDESHYQNGIKHGPSIETNGNGDKEERSYEEGFLEGPAILTGLNGDIFKFNYKKGIKNGNFTYTWKDGSKEVGLFDKEGNQNGPTKMTWANGSFREGVKKNGVWEGKVVYTHGKDTPMPGKRDLEIWGDGKLIKSQKYYGEEIVVDDWYDLDKLVDHDKTGACPMKSLHRCC